MPSSRRAFLAASASSLAGLAGCVSLDQPSAGGMWPRRTLTNAHTGHSPIDGPTQSLHTEWHRSRDANGVMPSSPVVRDGTLYFAYSRRGLLDNMGGAWLEAFDAATGESRWVTELFRNEEHHYFNQSDSLVLDGDRILIQTRPGLKAVGTDGTVRWTFDNLYRGQQASNVVPPVVTDDVVVTGTYGTATEPGQVEMVYALDPVTGEERWRTELPGLGGMVRLAAVDGVVYVPMKKPDGHIVALDLATGDERWRWSAPVEGLPTVVDGTLLTGLYEGINERSVAAVDLASRTIRWRKPIGYRTSGAGVSVANGLVYHVAGLGVDARKLEDGERVWRFGGDTQGREFVSDGTPKIDSSSTPVVAGASVYAPGWIQGETDDGQLFVLDARTGTEQSRIGFDRTPDESTSIPAVSSDLVFVSALGGELYAFGECNTPVLGRCVVD